jgi:hypothetical protein
MAEKLTSVLIGTPSFRHGYSLGIRHVYRGNLRLPNQATEEAICDVVRTLCELAADGELTDGLLRQDCGILVGWLSTVLVQPTEQ